MKNRRNRSFHELRRTEIAINRHFALSYGSRQRAGFFFDGEASANRKRRETGEP